MRHNRPGARTRRGAAQGAAAAVVLALVVAFATGLVGTAWADSASATETEAESLTVTEQLDIDTSGLADADELAAGYVEEALYGDDAGDGADDDSASTTDADASDSDSDDDASDSAATADGLTSSALDSEAASAANYGETYFASDADGLALYEALRDFVEEVAAEGGSSVFTYVTTYTIDSGQTLQEAFDEVYDVMTENVTDAIYCLLTDCPFDFYWYDKVTGASSSYTGTRSGSTLTMTLTISFAVSEDYAGDEKYVVSTPASSISTAKATAAAIVEEYASTTTVYTVLTAYKDEICALTSYNSEAASEDYDGGYGDPWQLIYVFDGDDSTTVVCEGYSKAFQYLCDLTWPTNDPVTCYTISGTMSSATSSGGHMWNLVTVDGATYLVDVTNSDTGTVGASGGLFLAYCSSNVSGSASAGYSVTLTVGSSTYTVGYTYGSAALSLYSTEQLTWASEAFSTTLTYVPLTSIAEATVTLDATSYTYDGSAKEPGVTVVLDGTTLTAGTDYTVSYADNVDAGTATVTVAGCGSYTGTVTATFTISAASLASATVALSSTSYTYSGSAKTPTPTVTLSGTTLTKGTDYTVSYADNTDVGTATVTVTGTGNYTGTASATFTIKAASIASATVTLSSTSYTYDGTAKTPTVTVTLSGTTLISGTDYTVSYSSNTSVGTATEVLLL